jgi:N-glycosidase YbiA
MDFDSPRTVLSADPDCICAWHSDEPHGWTVNFSPHAVELDGVRWPTVEHYYQAQKFPNSPDTVKRILAQPDPLGAKAIAHEGRDLGFARRDWDQVKDGVMKRGLVAKLDQHPELKELLLATGTKRIVEDSPEDYYWGCGRDGTGTNRMGALWEELRERLRAGKL